VRLLDLCCGAGGAGKGYADAGWEVEGVDIVAQPDYPYPFHLADGLEYLSEHWSEFDAVHGSPPCQASSTLSKGTNGNRYGHLDLVPAYRAAFKALPIPTIVENVKSAYLRPDLTLCGAMFGLKTYRHRYFELSFAVQNPPHPRHDGRTSGWRHGRLVKGSMVAVYGHGGYKGTKSEWQEVMETPWITKKRAIAQAIPPKYTQFIGSQLKNALERA
jgi:site-specific DNA-cytosine methylase